SLKALRSSERKFRNIFERSKDLIFVADKELYFTEVNDASVALLGYEKSALLSKSLFGLLVNPADRGSIHEQLEEWGEVSDKEVEILTNSGEKKNCIITLSVEMDITGQRYVQGIIHDISSLKRAEKATLMLEKLNVAGRLVRIMAHEVRNPLNNIMLSAEQLEPLIGSGDSGICLEIINRNSKRIGDLITELLNSSRPDHVSIEKSSLQSIMDEALEAAIDRIRLRHIQVERDFIAEPAWVMADSEKLKIAFLNIIINAIEAMPDNEGKLFISIKKKNIQYVVSIEDNGCGISDDNISHLFEPYFTSKPNGMGLGLAATLNILQSHNASVDVQSTLNEGTAFKLFFNVA
ncbi:MAG TPA: ATP-binding protein, partial [Ferruginibacter sp.]|nr:ATP-binding protein [Ferruginibacter sp.]